MSVNFKGWGILNFNRELLPIKCSDFMLNLPIAFIDKVYNDIVPSVCVCVCVCVFWFKFYSGLMKWDALNKIA